MAEMTGGVDEGARLEALYGYNILDTPAEASFDDIAAVAAHVAGTKTSLISLVDGERQWFKSRNNFRIVESGRDISFCAHAILQSDVMVVPDARLDARFSHNPLVVEDPAIRFYAGAPLVTPSGLALGTLCVIDYEPRELSPAQGEALQALARQVMKELELRRILYDLSATVTGRRRAATPEVLQAILDNAPAVIFLKDLEGRYLLVNKQFERVHGVSGADLVGKRDDTVLPKALSAAASRAEVRVIESLESVSGDMTLPSLDGQERTFNSVKFPLLDWAGRPFAVATIATEITERIRYERHLEYLADHDALTGLANRRRFERELDARLREIRRSGGSGAVLVLDVDNLKHINDSAGHRAGDQYIHSLGQRLRIELRDTDLLARLGGDEFGILVRQATAETAHITAERLLEAVRTHALDVGGRAVRTTASLGACVFAGRDLSQDDVQAAADTALYAAKDAGRDRFVFADEIPTNVAPRVRPTWVDRLREATLGVGFEMVAQPVIDLDSKEVAFHELLLRMRDPAGQYVLPGAFLPTAERFDLIQRVDRWVVAHAIDRLAEAKTDGLSLTFSVNLSGKSLRDEDLFQAVRLHLERADVDPARLIFEVTETVALENMVDAARLAANLRALGCGFALDDFGTGFGSFYYLKHLPLDLVKIDGDFVEQLAGSRLDQLVVESVVKVSQELGCRTVAEYVSADGVGLLVSLGVDLGQGFALGLPRPVSELFPSH